MFTTFKIEIQNIVTERGTQRVKSMIYDRKHSNVVIGYLNGSISIYNVEQKKQLIEKQISSTAIRGMSLICNNQAILVGDDKGILYLIDSNTLQKRLQFYAHLDSIRSVITHSQNQQLAFTAGDDAIVRVWYFENTNKQPQLLAELISEDNSPITCLQFDNIGNRLIVTQNHNIKIFDTSIFQDIDDFKLKVSQGKIGSVNIQTQSLIDQLNIKNLEKLGQYALNSVTNYVTGSQQQKEIRLDQAMTSLTAMYSVKSESQYTSALWVQGNVLSDLTQENPYSNGQLQYIAASTASNQIQIIDSYSKQQIKQIQLGYDNQIINQLLQIDDCLIAISNDNFVYFVDINEMKIQKQLNYQMERGWCGCNSKFGASNILGLGFDQGYVILQVGDVMAQTAIFQSQDTEKIRFCCQSDQINFNSQEKQFQCKIGKKLQFSNKIVDVFVNNEQQEFKEIDKQLQVKNISYTPNGKFIIVQTDNQAQILSALTGKEKSVIKGKNICWKQDFNTQKFVLQSSQYQIDVDESSLVYGVLSEKNYRTINIYDQQNDQEVLTQIQTDNTVQQLINGPVITAIEQGCVQFFTYEDGMFISQIDVQAKNIKWSINGELCMIISEDTLYILKFNFDKFIEGIQSDDYDESIGIEEAFEQLFSIEKEIDDVQISTDLSVLLIQNKKHVYQIWLQEAIKFDNIEMTELDLNNNQNVTMLQIIHIDNKNYLIYMYNDQQEFQYNISFMLIDTSLQEFKILVNEEKIDEAIQFAKQWQNNEGKLIGAAEYLSNIGKDQEIIEKILCNQQTIFKYACQNNDINLLIKYQDYEKQTVAAKCFEFGSIQTAQQIYEELQDYPMTLLCAYINGDEQMIQKLKENEKVQDNLKNQIKLILDEEIDNIEDVFENKELFTKDKLELIIQYVNSSQQQQPQYSQEFIQKFKNQLEQIGLKDLSESIK